MNRKNSSMEKPQVCNRATAENPSSKQRENLWLNLGLNILLPSFVLMKTSKWFGLNPAVVLLLALLFPLGYGIYDFIARRKYNFFSILGFISIFITGSVGLLKLDNNWIAIKEAAVPLLFGFATLVTLKTGKPLVRLFLFNNQIFDVPKIETTLKKRHNRAAFDRLLGFSTLLLALSFLLSAMLNFGLAKFFIRSESGSEAFNAELGRMTLWSWPTIVLPSMVVTLLALWKLLTGIKKLTGFELEEILRHDRPS